MQDVDVVVVVLATVTAVTVLLSGSSENRSYKSMSSEICFTEEIFC